MRSLLVLSVLAVSHASPSWVQAAPQGPPLASPLVEDHPVEAHPSPEPRRLEAGLGVNAAPTLLTELYFMAQDQGLLTRGGRTWLRAGLAPLAGWDNTELALERWETVVLSHQQRLELLAGAQWAHGSDWAAKYDTLGALFGLRYGYTWGTSTLGAHVSYQLGIASWLHFSDAYQASYGERYPDDRATRGPELATLLFGSHRVEAALNYTFQTARWSLWSALGIQASPSAGPLWDSLDVGQLPVLVRCAGGYRF